MTSPEDKQRILVVDDLRMNAIMLKKMLEPEWAVHMALSGAEALQCAAQRPAPDLILLDVRMPDMDGHEVCRQLKQNPDTGDIPVIFITAIEDGNTEAQGLALGAVDYITRPVCAPIVRERIRNHLALHTALAELALKNKILERLAAHDPLTGLYNRRKLDETLTLEVLRAERYRRPLSLIMIDIDHFKQVNDTYGHPVGDAVLAESANRLTQTLRTSDIPGRWGGEEFVVICPETSLEGATILAERLRKNHCVRDFDPVGSLTASFGVASHRRGLAAQEIVRHADGALYKAKQTGRNRVVQEQR